MILTSMKYCSKSLKPLPTVQRPIKACLSMVFLCLSALSPLVAMTAQPAMAATLQEQFAKSVASSMKTVSHKAFTSLLKTHVVKQATGLTRVNYAGLKTKQTVLRAYIVSLQAIKVSGLNKPEQFAFWANLYNAVTLNVVLDAYPVKSIKDIDISPGIFSNGPWGKKLVTVEGIKLSLDDIEHKILRGLHKDPRIHYSVNCASIGCPNLRLEAFTGANLQQQLDAAASDYINSPRGVVIKNGRVSASKIYSWFKKDFGGGQAGVLAHLKKYANQNLKAKLSQVSSINGYFYDWTLNDTTE